MPSAGANAARDLVFTFYTESWANAVGREMYMTGPRLLATLMSEPSVRRLLVANPYRSAPIQWARRLTGQRPPPFPANAGRALVEPMRIGRRDPTSVRALERIYRTYDQVLEAAAAKLGADRPTIITTNPFVAGFSPLRWASQVTFYAWDDWRGGQGVRQWWTAYDAAFARIRESGRAVVGVSQAVLDGIQPTGARAVIPNGVVPAEWQQIGAPPAWFTALRPPRILYVGAMVAERLDVKALGEIAARFSHGSLVLVGPVVDPKHLDPLRVYPNVWIQPPVDHAEIRSVVQAADVCIMPHLFNRVTAAMSPLKLYEYVAAGRPVAASDLPPVRTIDPRIVRVPQAHSFADGVEEALRRGPLGEADRLAFIDANSWSRRHAQILRIAFGLPAAEEIELTEGCRVRPSA
jgi:teichuronic acid biosynthesis glycosyltransferase TuaH